MSENEEEELVRLNDIFKTLKEDALEVTDLIVKGIDYYKILAYIAIAAGIFSLWNIQNYVRASDLIQITIWSIFTIFFFIAIPYGFYKNRQLKKKYHELIDIHESLAED
jgi:hypothetical protein